MFKRAVLRGLIAVVGLVGGVASDARADIVVGLPAVTLDGVNGYKWDYGVSLSPSEEIRAATGNFFTIYDFFGFTGMVSTPAGWTLSTTTVGLTPVDPISGLPLGAADDPGIPNLTWSYTGSTDITTPGSGNVFVGTFSAWSSYGVRAEDHYAAQAWDDTTGRIDTTLSSTDVPVPEPGSIFLLGSALLGAASVVRRRTARKAEQ